MSATCNPIQASLEWCEGTSSFAGLRRRVWVCARSNIAAGNILFDADAAQYHGTFFCKESSYGFVHYDIDAAKSTAQSSAQGEYPSQTSLDTVTLVIPVAGSRAQRLAQQSNNIDNIYIIEDANGKARILGAEEIWPVDSETEVDYGTAGEGAVSTKLTAKCTNRVPFPEFVGSVQVAEDMYIHFPGASVYDNPGDYLTDY